MGEGGAQERADRAVDAVGPARGGTREMDRITHETFGSAGMMLKRGARGT